VFEILARDPRSGTTTTPAAASAFRVDTTGPSITFLSAPPPSTKARTSTFRFVVDERTSSIRCSIDGGGAHDCEAGVLTVGHLRAGSHTLAINARDQVGNVTVERFEWEVDRKAPDVSIKGAPQPFSPERDAIFDLHSDALPAFFLCQIDGSPPMPCFTATVITGLDDGSHRFVAWALDAAMNRSPRVALRWRVDTIAPGLLLTGRPEQGETTSSQTASFSIHANEPVSYFCSRDGAPYVPCGAIVDYAGFLPGAHEFSAYVVDRAGNESIVVGRTWTVA
jgi:hypothetical protein